MVWRASGLSRLKSAVTSGTWDEAPRWLLTAFVLASGALATVGISNSAFQRALTNERGVFMVAVGLLFGTLVLGAIGVAADKGAKGSLSLLGLTTFYLGGVLLLIAVSQSEYIRERPTITSVVRDDAETGNLLLDVSVAANRLLARDHLFIVVSGAPTSGSDSGLVRLYDVRTGPDREGKLSSQFAVPVPRGEFEEVHVGVVRVEGDPSAEVRRSVSCADAETTLISCSTIRLPSRRATPSVEIAFAGTGSDRVMTVKYSQADLKASEALVAEASEMSGMTLSDGWAAPNGGVASGTLNIPLGSGTSPICVRVWVHSPSSEISRPPDVCSAPTAAAFTTIVNLSRLVAAPQ